MTEFRELDRQILWPTNRLLQTDRQTGKKAARWTGTIARQTDGQTDRQIDTAARQGHRQEGTAASQADRQTDRQAARQTGRGLTGEECSLVLPRRILCARVRGEGRFTQNTPVYTAPHIKTPSMSQPPLSTVQPDRG